MNAKRAAERIVGRTRASNLGPDPYTCEYCGSRMEHGYCSKCLVQRYPQPAARQCAKCGGAIPEGAQCESEKCAVFYPYRHRPDRSASDANPALDVLIRLVDDLTDAHRNEVDEQGQPESLDEILQWKSMVDARSVIKTMKPAGLEDRGPQGPVKVAPDDPDHFRRLKEEQQWDRDRRRQHGPSDQPL